MSSYTMKEQEMEDKHQLDVFKYAISDYKKVGERKQYIGSILSNYGLGPDSNQKAAEQVDAALTTH